MSSSVETDGDWYNLVEWYLKESHAEEGNGALAHVSRAADLEEQIKQFLLSVCECPHPDFATQMNLVSETLKNLASSSGGAEGTLCSEVRLAYERHLAHVFLNLVRLCAHGHVNGLIRDE
jgi:hypothetical protein